ncbi:type II secretory pathway pseudopilin PulG [Sedimentibacter acidaminivorans]|uniref:Type II secretory pathway pseudopilin PulG n=1 Tax=Sedimentibacter acidaminivorans TaxID=913099 RepID=A0ABS4GIF9_9FIRM|nr:hypothetical protein [Sedimentibacter acidaminivorans]MBP1927327.1 type II secretory pathway pseudopilin PulG [Sedimentibacter acidaminivorans]
MKRLFGIDGLTIVEIIISLAILGIVICPLMSMFIFSQKLNNESEIEYKSILQAQNYMEEIQAMDTLDTTNYQFNSENDYYKRIINESVNNYSTEIIIKPDSRNMIFNIEIVLKHDGQVINKLKGSKIFNYEFLCDGC